jgi:hypothetical protein
VLRIRKELSKCAKSARRRGEDVESRLLGGKPRLD